MQKVDMRKFSNALLLTVETLKLAKNNLEELEKKSDEAFLIRAEMDRKLEHL